MPDPTNDELSDFESLLDLRLEQADRIEGIITDDLDHALEVKATCEAALRVDLARIVERMPWRGGPEGDILDLREWRRIQKLRSAAMDRIDLEFIRLGRGVLPPSLVQQA